MNLTNTKFTNIFFLFIAYLFSSSCWSSNGVVVLLYPDAEEPYKTLFRQIMDGFESQISYETKAKAVSNNLNITTIQQWFKDIDDVRAVVALDKLAYNAAINLNTDLPIYAGTYELVPGASNVPGVSVYTHPSRMFEQLKKIAPHIKSVRFVHMAQTDTALTRLVKSRAEYERIELSLLEIKDIRDAVYKINTLMQEIDPKREAIWFGHGVLHLNEELLLPGVLEAAWKREIVVFSSNPSYVARGFLFSIFPDYKGIGRNLAAIVNRDLVKNQFASINDKFPTNEIRIPVQLLEYTKLVLNRRTAKHFDIKITSELENEVSIFLPYR